jgi:hypothetical protein
LVGQYDGTNGLGTDNSDRYVPKPKPGVFRITKNVHNILQGVAAEGERISTLDKNILTQWIDDNAQRYWLSEGGPLRPPSEGGAEIIVVCISLQINPQKF